jgi:Adenylosuccinate synthetase
MQITNFTRRSLHHKQVKAYTTRVGEGPYPTEIHGNLAEELREEGGEYGTTTGRPRRVGWLDIPALQYVTRWGPATVKAGCVCNRQHACRTCMHMAWLRWSCATSWP